MCLHVCVEMGGVNYVVYQQYKVPFALWRYWESILAVFIAQSELRLLINSPLPFTLSLITRAAISLLYPCNITKHATQRDNGFFHYERRT